MQRFKRHIFSVGVLPVLILIVSLPVFCQAQIAKEKQSLADNLKKASFQLSISNGLVSLQAREADLSRILEEISRKTGVEIVMGAPTRRNISASFHRLPLDAALERITNSRGIVFSRTKGGDEYRIKRVVVFPSSNSNYTADTETNALHPADSDRIGATDLFSEYGNKNPGQASGGTMTIVDRERGTESRVVSNELIVRFRKGVSEQEIHALIAQTGATIKRRLKTIDYYVLTLPDSLQVNEALAWFQRHKIVETVEPNYIIPLQEEPPEPPDDEYFHSFQWPLHNTGQTGGPEDTDIDALEAWEIEQGSPEVVIAVIDTGVDYNHPDLVANIWQNHGEIAGEGEIDDDGNGYVDDTRGWDFVHEDNDPMDEHGHGTHVAGIAGAVTNNGTGIAGLAWNCRIMPVRAGNSGGVFTSEDAAQAIVYAAENQANVINLSWGGYDKISLIDDAMAFATDRGALICAAGGNDDSSNLVYPAAFRNDAVIAVGATDDEDQKAVFSNYGDWVQVSAPGDGPALGDSVSRGIYSTFLDGGYRQMRGTSMATPHVSGTAALLFSLFPDMSSLEVKTQIMRSVDVIEDLRGTNITSGRINAHKALTETYVTPFIFSVRPDEAHEGDQISILGDQFGENETGAGVVTFDGELEAEIISWSSSAIVCQVPEGAETGHIRVTTPEGTSNGIPVTILVTYYDEELIDHRFLGEGTPMGWHADDRSWEYVLPFSFPFFGHNHDAVYVCSNGFLVFDDDSFSSYDNEPAIFKTKVMIAPLWDDLVTTGSSGEDIYIYSPSPDSVSFRWAGKRYGNTDPINVEAILHKDGRIEFNYGSGNADLSPTIGISSGEGGEYHLSLYDGSSRLEKAETVLFTPLGFLAAGTEREESGGGSGGSRCFIATAAFGSPWERHVCILRTFRDRYLETSWPGRLLVRTYETCSPPLARFIRKHEPARSVVRLMLLPWVAVAYALLYFRFKVAIVVLALIVVASRLFLFLKAQRSLA